MRKNHKKKLPIGVKIIIGILIAVFVSGIGVYAFVQSQLSKINKAEATEAIDPSEEYFDEDESTEESGLAELDPAEIQWAINSEVMADKDVVNILLIGQDRREGESRARSDSMILATINKKKSTIQLTSFMRDLYVQIPGYSDNRINAAYAFGGMELLNATIETNFGISIDGNIEVDFAGFKTCIDKISGIDLELTQEEADYLNEKGNWDDNNASAGTWNLTAGMNHLNGEQALAYSRIRYIGNSDYERTERQRKVLMTAFSKMKDEDLSTILSLIDEAFPLLTTDITHGELLGYAVNVVSMGVEEIESYRIPVDGTYQAAVIRKMQVLVPDLEANRQFLKETLYLE